MKKICKIIVTCIVFFIITTKNYATTDILPENKFGIKKAAILGAGVFLVVQILFIAYQKDKIEEKSIIDEQEIEKNLKIEKLNKIDNTEELILKFENSKLDEKVDNVFAVEELEKIEKEEKELFDSLKTKTEIETLPDIMSPKKRNIRLKKESNIVEEKKANTLENKIVPRSNVKIVRERKNRNITQNLKKEATKLEVEAKKVKTKLETEEKKKIVKAQGEAKKQEIKAEVKEKKKKSKK